MGNKASRAVPGYSPELSLVVRQRRSEGCPTGWKVIKSAKQLDALGQGRLPDHEKISAVYCGDSRAKPAVRLLKVTPSRDEWEREVDLNRVVAPLGLTPRVLDSWTLSTKYALVMEWLQGNNLFMALSWVEPANRLRVYLAALRVLQGIHGAGVTHGDPHLLNFVVDDYHSQEPEVKIIDFGMGNRYQDGKAVYPLDYDRLPELSRLTDFEYSVLLDLGFFYLAVLSSEMLRSKADGVEAVIDGLGVDRTAVDLYLNTYRERTAAWNKRDDIYRLLDSR